MTMTNKLIQDDYYQNVIQRWDEASGEFKAACDEANQKTYPAREGLLEERTIKSSPSIVRSRTEIDGNGNKPRIYCNQFENIFQALEKSKISREEAKEEAKELRYRLLLDLIAMNADDLRKGEIALMVTNIIDINHLKWPRWHLFQESMAEAMKKVILEVDIPMTAGETAVLWPNEEARKIKKATVEAMKEIQKILDKNKPTRGKTNRMTWIQDIINNLTNQIEIIGEGISFNIGWTVVWYSPNKKKLANIEDRGLRWIIALEEQSQDWIIWPRANGITKIIEDMIEIMGEWRENKTFEEFVTTIGEEKAAEIPKHVSKVCTGKKMRDIATGRTTVFNPFISKTLLGWIEGDPIAKIAKLIHITGNPLKKIVEWVGNENYRIEIDMRGITSPQIITLLQIAKDIPDGVVANKFNMGMPYAIVVAEEDIDKVIEEASKAWYTASRRWQVHQRDVPNRMLWVWLNKTTIEF